MTRNLFIEKTNERFRAMTKTRQASGLSVCLDMISSSVKDSIKIVVSDFRHIEVAVSRFAPKNLILGSNFLNAHEIKLLRSRFPFLRVYLIIHSPASFLAVDQGALKSVYDAVDNGVRVIFNDPRMKGVVEGSIFLENCYSIPFFEYSPPKTNGEFNVICSGSVRVLKNHLTQAIAAMKYCDENDLVLNFHCNMGRSELGGAVLASLKTLFQRNQRHKLISLPWQEHKEFLRSLSKYHLGMQVSFTESYNIVSADYIAAGLPMVVSEEIRFASNMIKCRPNDIEGMVRAISIAPDRVKDSRKLLRLNNEEAVKMWNMELNSRV